VKRASVYFLADYRKVSDPLGCCLRSHREKGCGWFKVSCYACEPGEPGEPGSL